MNHSSLNKSITPGCSWKWEFLLYNAKTGYAAMCCDHEGAKANVIELQTDISRLINSPTMLADRSAMIRGETLDKCQGCHRHITENTNIGGTFYDNHNTSPESTGLKSIGIMLNTTCLYTCFYCSSHFSSSWYSDIEKNGSYKLFDQEAHTLSTHDRVQHKISMNDVGQIEYTKILDKLLTSELTDELSTLRIGGGEPLLHNNLIDFITNLSNIKPNLNIEIYTGLGVSQPVFDAFIKNTIKFKDRLRIVLSQEAIGVQSEFMRYGTDWAKWLSKAENLLAEGYHVEFNSVLNSVSLFTLKDFIKWKLTSPFKNCIVRIQPLKGPRYLSISTLDKLLHEELLDKLLSADFNYDPTRYLPAYQHFERENLLAFLTEFAARRNLSLDIFPSNFLDWLYGK